jgi:hypothetical protein
MAQIVLDHVEKAYPGGVKAVDGLTSMLHALPGATGFDLRRQHGELELVTGSAAGSTYLAEAYTGWPSH